MAIYTVELGTILKSNFDIGLKNYPCYSEEIRERINSKIKEHFYFREIGAETPELFKRFLNRKMNEIMPYYNQLYKSEDLKYNPLYNVELTETFTREKTNNSNGNSKTTTDTKNNQSENAQSNTTSSNDGGDLLVFSDNPISGVTETDMLNGNLATTSSLGKNHEKSNNETTNKRNTTDSQNMMANGEIKSNMDEKEEFTRKTEGSSAGLSFSKALLQWREVMINIDMLIIDELEPLFMCIY